MPGYGRRVMAGRRRVSASLLFGTTLGIAGLVFVTVKIHEQWGQVRHRLADVDASWLGLGILLAIAGMTAIAIAWRPVLVALGAEQPTRRAVVRWYYVGEIGKYVPGGIWTFVGRAELARRGGLDRPSAYGSVALSLALLQVAAACVAAVVLPFTSITRHSAAAWLVLLVVPVGLALLHHRVLEPLLAFVERATKRSLTITVPPFATTLRLVAGYIPAWLAIGTGTWAIARAFDAHAPFASVFAATIVSWIVGFLVLVVPGGVGVRESVFVAVLTLPGGVAATTALVARLVFMVVDGAGAIFTPIIFRRHGNATTAGSAQTLQP